MIIKFLAYVREKEKRRSWSFAKPLSHPKMEGLDKLQISA
jgi:hypothetical protein